jgi:Coenzyme PQQ synthesis protein D (PqqD)
MGDGIVLADVDREDFELLSETAAAAWRSLARPLTLTELIRSLAMRYGTAPEAIHSDVASLVQDLIERGAVVRIPAHVE